MSTTFIDKAKIFVSAGSGGNGCLSFRREKFIPWGGPNGGNGGRGGDVYLVADFHFRTLLDLALKPHCKADNGMPGQGSDKQGRSGEDLFIKVPLGTVVHIGSKVVADLTRQDEQYLVAHGGRGGRGNAAFKSSRNTAPRIAEKGEPGEEITVELELKLIAEVGVIGLPNAGKSTLLSRLTSAHPKIASYPFTTLTPNLGVAAYQDFQFVIADIPGLIEGAHEGKGLGHEFLRHVERTKVLVHLVDASGFDGSTPEKDMETVKKELKAYSPALARKPQIIVLTKMDLLASPATVLARFKKKVKKGDQILMISAVTNKGLDVLLRTIVKTLQAIPQELPPPQAPLHVILEPDARVERDGEVFVVTGKKIERFAAMTDFNLPEASHRFQNLLKKLGVERLLKDSGACTGDPVRIGKEEFSFEPDLKL